MTIDGIYSVFTVVLKMSLSATVLIILALFMRLLLGNWVSFKVFDLVSGLILIVLTLPVLPASEFSMLGLITVFGVNSAAEISELSVSPGLMDMGGYGESLKGELTLFELCSTVWAIGVVVLLFRYSIQYVRASWWIQRQAVANDSQLLQLLDECRIQIGLSKTPMLHLVDGLESPAAFGVVSPRVLLPERLLLELSREEIRHVFLHELCHIKRRDPLAGLIANMVGLVHWFNPLVGVLARKLADDREVLCDQAVVGLLGPNQQAKRAYGETLVHLLYLFSFSSRTRTGIVSFISWGSGVKRRILMISCKSRTRWYEGVVGMTAFVLFGVTGLTVAAPADVSGYPQSRDHVSWHESRTGESGLEGHSHHRRWNGVISLEYRE